MGIHSVPAPQRTFIGSTLEPFSGPLAISVLKLLEAANREIDRDASAAKAVIATAASLLQTQIAGVNCKKRLKIASGGLAGWQEQRLRAHCRAAIKVRIQRQSG